MAENTRPLLISSTCKCCMGLLSRDAEGGREAQRGSRVGVGVGGKDWLQGVGSETLLDNKY